MSITKEKFNNETWFKISDSDSLRPFFMSIVSDSNHWMFISSNGGLTAGRKNAEYALFPYYTEDKITELAHTTGSKTILQVKVKGEWIVWEPFSDRDETRYEITRNLYKNWYGNKILFEETNHTIGLTFRYQWNSSNSYGFVRNASLLNHSGEDIMVKILDGIQNILPYGVNSDLQNRSSNLVDAYKRNELVPETGLGIYALSAIPVDKAEPSEALKANIAWSLGLDDPKYLVSSLQLDHFRNKEPLEQEEDVKAEKGAYFVVSKIHLEENALKEWKILANVNQNHADIAKLDQSLREGDSLNEKVSKDIERGTKKLKELVAGADGLQQSADELKNARHYSNVLFNIMRGGTFDHNYRIEKKDFAEYLNRANTRVFEEHQDFINGLEEKFDKQELTKKLSDCEDPDLIRLGKEYLPLKFSRRHGDPSRPWNKFSINTHNELDGSKVLDYEGNWRDIFQNWEALVHAYPEFIEGMIYKFLNASTFDGYNPYRVTKDGIDWEVADPDDPWSYIGYWGDHQIIYLLKFLEFYDEHAPEKFKELFSKEEFVYANVPYRIKPYKEIAKDPKDTIEFDGTSDEAIKERMESMGADGALFGARNGKIYHVSFVEKLLATVLAKMSNYIPEAGIWMNTQRPEWNDANNALVGNGVSMVTLYYLHRFIGFLEPVIKQLKQDSFLVSEELKHFFEEVSGILAGHRELLNGKITDKDRKEVTEQLGEAGSSYRMKVYNDGFSRSKKKVSLEQLQDFIEITKAHLQHAIRANRRSDDLYHAYNIMSIEEDGISISYLDEMLEGQVAVLSSNYLPAEECLKVLDALRNSDLYRDDQQSYILYPNKSLPGFLEKNNIPESEVEDSELLQQLVADGNLRILNKDVYGRYHFNGSFNNARDLRKALQDLKSTNYSELVEKEEEKVLQVFEEVFNHKAFTGRSGTFFAYEGLGSIYWHMVSKLHLAVEEVCEQANKEDTGESVKAKLANHFDEIGKGIGIHKAPEVYGAFPTDPYSHTPEHRGAQQPGMTGQVKEDIIVRIGELGVSVKNGKLSFDPFLLSKGEFSSTIQQMDLVALDKQPYKIKVPEQSLAFTICQVPVVYTLSNQAGIKVELQDDTFTFQKGLQLDDVTTRHIFERSRVIKQLTVSLPEENLRPAKSNQ